MLDFAIFIIRQFGLLIGNVMNINMIISDGTYIPFGSLIIFIFLIFIFIRLILVLTNKSTINNGRR